MVKKKLTQFNKHVTLLQDCFFMFLPLAGKLSFPLQSSRVYGKTKSHLARKNNAQADEIRT